MCGIIGYVGNRQAPPILLEGLKRMEYRGYDSAGIAVLADASVWCQKAVGKIDGLEEKMRSVTVPEGTIGIGHSRWATHGGVTEANAHPHADCTGSIWLAHNGIVENYKELKEKLIAAGHTFTSETDTEVIAHLIEEVKRQKTNDKGKQISFEEAVRLALKKIRGTWGLAILNKNDPEKLIAARNFSPLLLGIGDSEYFVASDASAVLKHTKHVIYLDDGEMAVLTPRGHRVYDLGWHQREKEVQEIPWSLEQAEKGGHPHFMHKEIWEGPEAVENSTRGRLIADDGVSILGGLAGVEKPLRDARRIIIVACGTAYLAGRIAEYMLEEYAGIPVEVDLASEFRYRKPIFSEGDILLAISQSGETADTLAALREAKRKGILTIGIVNAVGSSLARETDAGVYQHAGPEIGVASTKAFLSQIGIAGLMTLLLGRQREMSVVTGQRMARELKRIPSLIRLTLEAEQEVERIAKKYIDARHFFFLGRKYNYPVALEGALKLKEISYIHAEGYGAGELKHGPIALIDGDFPSVCIAPRDSVYEKMLSNIQEIKARGGPVIAIATQGDNDIRDLADEVVYIPKTLELLTPMLSVVPLQLLAYHFGVLKGYDVDKPRNLAKSVTVE